MYISPLSSSDLFNSEKVKEVEKSELRQVEEMKEVAAVAEEPVKKKEIAEEDEETSKILNLFKKINSLDSEIISLRNSKDQIKQKPGEEGELQAKEEALQNIEKILADANENQELNLQELAKLTKVTSIKNKIEFSSEERDYAFKIEIFFRTQLEVIKKEAHSERLTKFYEEQLIPIVRAIKTSIKQKARTRIFREAAEIGARRSESWQGLISVQCSKNRIVTTLEKSKQAVYLRAQEGIVIKQGDARAREEESLIEQIVQFFPGAEIMLSTKIRKAIPAHLGISSIKQEERLRGFSNKELTLGMKEKIKKQMSAEMRSQLQEYEDYRESIVFLPDLRDPACRNVYKICEAQKWIITDEGLERQISFKEVHILYLKEGDLIFSRLSILEPTFPKEKIFDVILDALSVNWIAIVPEKGEGFPQASSIHQKDRRGYRGVDPLIKANIVERMKPQDRLRLREFEEKLAKEAYRDQIIFLPDLSLTYHKKVFEACEACKWTIDGSETRKTFREIQVLYLKEGSACLPKIKSSDKKPLSHGQAVSLAAAFSVNWVAVFPELLQQVQEGSQTGMQVLESFTVKPFASRMILVKTIQQDPAFLNGVFRNLTPQAQRTSILTGELQMLDLHSENLGVEPVPNKEFYQFESEIFSIKRAVKFHVLLQEYVAGRIDDNTTIRYGGTEAAIKSIPGLSLALKVQWKLVIFDTDLSMTEGNELMTMTYNGGPLQHLIPLRSVILEGPGKDVPLSPECLDLLKQSEFTRKELEFWMKRYDAPLWIGLSTDDREAIEKELFPLFERYSISRYRKRISDITVAGLRRKFSRTISDPIKYANIWQRLESAVVRDGDSLKTFSQRHKVTIQKLEALNPQLRELDEEASLKDSGLLTSKGSMNGRLRTRELSDLSDQAVKHRLQLALQLFPRVTLGQQRAFIEREEKLISYLRDYEQLKIQSQQLDDESLKKLVKEFYGKHSIFSTIMQEDLIKTIGSVNPEELQQVIKYAEPTYFKAMQVMYPLLADTYELITLVYPQEAYPGSKIGLYTHSIQKLIQDGLQNSNRKVRMYTNSLWIRMQEVEKRVLAASRELPFFITHVD